MPMQVCAACMSAITIKWALQDLNLFRWVVPTSFRFVTSGNNSCRCLCLGSRAVQHRVASVLYGSVQHGGTFEAPEFKATRSPVNLSGPFNDVSTARASAARAEFRNAPPAQAIVSASESP